MRRLGWVTQHSLIFWTYSPIPSPPPDGQHSIMQQGRQILCNNQAPGLQLDLRARPTSQAYSIRPTTICVQLGLKLGLHIQAYIYRPTARPFSRPAASPLHCKLQLGDPSNGDTTCKECAVRNLKTSYNTVILLNCPTEYYS